MTDRSSPHPGVPPDFRHMNLAANAIKNNPDAARMTHAIDLLGEGLSLAPLLTFDLAGPNDLSAVACLTRAYRQLGAAVHLLMVGYYGEVRLLLRGVFECASLSRMLAKNPEQAENWLRKIDRFPNDKVRKWWNGAYTNQFGSPEETLSLYTGFYRMMTSWAHPTPVSCMPLIRPMDADPERPVLHLESAFAEEEFGQHLVEIAGAALFACFALRNAAVDEQAIDPGWRKHLHDLSQEILNRAMPHLERNWDEEQRQYEDLQRKVQSADQLEETLDTAPSSWRNLQKLGVADAGPASDDDDS